MARTPAGELTGTFRAEIYTKTVCDASRYSDAKMASKGARAAREAIFPADPNKRITEITIDGLNFRVYRNTSGDVISSHIKQ